MDSCDDWDDNGVCNSTGAGTVTIKTSSSINNGGSGFDIYAKGAITIADAFISDNNGAGYRLYNPLAPTLAPITLTNTNSYQNGLDGYEIITRGAVTMTNFNASDNLGDGVHIANQATSAAVTLTNLGNVFNNTSNNAGDGFEIFSRGPVTVINTDSTGNRGYGGYIDNSSAIVAAPVTVKVNVPFETVNGYFDNGDGGLSINSKGAVTVTNFRISDNSINYGGIGNGEHWFDNMNRNQTWFFDASLMDDVTIEVNTIHFNPSIGIFYVDEFGTWSDVDYADGTDGSVTLSLTDLDAGEYAIQIYTDQPWSTGTYDISLVDDNNIPPFMVNHESLANGITVINTSGVNMPVSITNAVRDWNGNNSGSGIVVFSNGLVTLTNMDLNENGKDGLKIDNRTSSASAGATLSGVSFSGNARFGAEIASKGALTLTNAYAEWNGDDGAILDNTAGTGGVTLAASGTNQGNYFDRNAGSGLVILTNGAVSLTNVDANENATFGLLINNTGGTAPVTIKESGNWNNWYTANGLNGLTIVSRGPVTVSFRRANDNGGTGIFIDASGGTGAVSLAGTIGRNAEVRNNGTINGDNGITILSKGNITLARVEVRENFTNGAELENSTGSGMVTITDGFFDQNYNGLIVNSFGAVVWKNGSANENGNYGAYIKNDDVLLGKPVTIANVYASNNHETGLWVESKGAVTITNTEANNNSANYYVIGYGEQWFDNLSDDQTWIFNAQAGDSDDVTITVNSDKFNPSVEVFNLDWASLGYANGADGSVELSLTDLVEGEYYIRVYTNQGWNGYGYDISIYEGLTEPVTWDGEESYAYGMLIDNRFGVNAPVSITNTSPMWNGNNSKSNYYILASGAVTLTNMDLNDSRGNGLYIDNTYNTGTPAVTLTNVNTFENGGNGLEIYSNGAVIIKTSSSGGSGGFGYYIDNSAGTGSVTLTSIDVNRTVNHGISVRSQGIVTLTNVRQQESGDIGIWIDTSGAVIFNKVEARRNANYGAYVTTDGTFTTIKPALGQGYNTFEDNGLTGLYVTADGKITLAQVRAHNNGRRDNEGTIVSYAYGVFLDNTTNGPPGTAPITLTNVETHWNTMNGLQITTTSAATLTGVRAEGNNDFGIQLLQEPGPILAPVITLTDITTNNNGWDGLYVNVLGNIIVNKLNSVGNGATGINLLNNTGLGTVTVLNTKGANFVGFNGGVGLNISSNRAISVTGVEALGNTQDGVAIWNDTTSVPSAVTMNSLILRNNGWSGLSVHSLGVVTVNNSWSVSNGQDGMLLVTYANTFINNSNSINNDWTGFYVDMRPEGVIDPTIFTLKLTNCTWMGNLRNPNPGDLNLMVDGNYIIL